MRAASVKVLIGSLGCSDAGKGFVLAFSVMC